MNLHSDQFLLVERAQALNTTEDGVLVSVPALPRAIDAYRHDISLAHYHGLLKMGKIVV